MEPEIVIGRITMSLLRVRLANALHEVDCGCDDFGDPRTDSDDRYIKSVDAALASLASAALEAPDA